MCELIGRRVGEAVVLACITGRKHVISSFLAKARSGLGSGSGRGLMWVADPRGMEAWGFLQGGALLHGGPVLGLWVFLKQRQGEAALGTAPAKAVGCPVYSEHELGVGVMTWQRGLVLNGVFPLVLFLHPVSLPHFPCTWTCRLQLKSSNNDHPIVHSSARGEEAGVQNGIFPDNRGWLAEWGSWLRSAMPWFGEPWEEKMLFLVAWGLFFPLLPDSVGVKGVQG